MFVPFKIRPQFITLVYPRSGITARYILFSIIPLYYSLLGFIPLQYYYILLGFIQLQYYCRPLLFNPLQYYTITRGSRPDILSLVLSSGTIFSLELSLSPILRHLPWLYPAPILLYAPGDCPSPVLLYSPCILSLSPALSPFIRRYFSGYYIFP